MDVVAFLPRHLLAHLNLVLGGEHRLTAVAGWAELRLSIQHGTAELVVADPAADGAPKVEALEQIRLQFPTLPVVVYTGLSSHTVKAIVRLARVGIEHVVLHRFDDEPRKFLQLLESIRSTALGDQMLQELAGALAALPVTVVRAIDQLFRSPQQFRSTQDLAAAARMNLRTLYRNLEPAGFQSPRLLVVAARLLRAYGYLLDPGRSIKDVASRMGYSSSWQLSQQMREMTGRTTEQVRREVSGDELIVQLADRLRQGRQTR